MVWIRRGNAQKGARRFKQRAEEVMKKILRLMSEPSRKRLAFALFKNQAEFLNTLGGNTWLH